jgi:DNA repair exonuclease SbcCD ATPase subunit
VSPARAVALVRLAGSMLLPLTLAAASLSAQAANIYTCVNAKGQRITSDRPIAECIDRAQELRNTDGSVKQVVPPSMTAEERAAHEERLRQEMAAEAVRRDAIRRDRNLLSRYPDELRHQRARTAALEPLNTALQATERRLTELEHDQKRLQQEAEFFKGRELPRELKVKFGQNQAALQAQQDAAQNHQAEISRINTTYDQELTRLKRLWAGAAPGSVSLPASSSASR